MLRVQLNILAGYLYDQQLSSTAGISSFILITEHGDLMTVLGTPQLNNNNKLQKLSTELQEKFLSICNNFVSEGENQWSLCVP